MASATIFRSDEYQGGFVVGPFPLPTGKCSILLSGSGTVSAFSAGGVPVAAVGGVYSSSVPLWFKLVVNTLGTVSVAKSDV